MTEITIQLPAYVFEDGFAKLVASLAPGDASDVTSITLDFHFLKYYIPLGVTMVTSTVGDWLSQRKQIRFSNHHANPAFRYLQRIDFFNHAGLILDEDFERHPSGAAFVPI